MDTQQFKVVMEALADSIDKATDAVKSNTDFLVCNSTEVASILSHTGLTPAQKREILAKEEALRRAEDYRKASGLKIIPEDVEFLATWLQEAFRKAKRLDEEDLEGYFLRLARRDLTGEWRG